MLLCAHLCNTQGLTSKNAKQRTECLLEMGAMIERDGLTVAGLVYSPFALSFSLSLSLSLSLSICLSVCPHLSSINAYLSHICRGPFASLFLLPCHVGIDRSLSIPTNKCVLRGRCSCSHRQISINAYLLMCITRFLYSYRQIPWCCQVGADDSGSGL